MRDRQSYFIGTYFDPSSRLFFVIFLPSFVIGSPLLFTISLSD